MRKKMKGIKATKQKMPGQHQRNLRTQKSLVKLIRKSFNPVLMYPGKRKRSPDRKAPTN
jgi:hypothetical protein